MARKAFFRLRIILPLLAFCFAGIALSGWITGNLVLASIFPGWKAMAPLTTINMMLVCASLCSMNIHVRGRLVATALVLSALAILAITSLDRLGIAFHGIEYSLIPSTALSTISSINTGKMSPLTFAVFIVSSITLLFLNCIKNSISCSIAFAAGILVSFSGIIILAGYIQQNPVLSGIVSLSTGISFVLFGTGLLLSTDPNIFPASVLLGTKTSAHIMRRIFPLVIAIILAQGIINRMSEIFPFEPVILTAFTIAFFIVLAAMVSAKVSSATGKTVERLIAEREAEHTRFVKSEKRYRTLVESLQEGIAILDAEGKIEYSNPRMNELLGLSIQDAEKADFFKIVIPETSEGTEIITECLSRGTVVHNDYQLVRADGRIVFAIVTFVPLMNKHNVCTGTIAGVVDITDKKNTEIELIESIKTREVLLRELYHRTKNNMQIICSLIRMRYKDMPDAASLQIFKEIENRIAAMALVHEKIYKTNDLNHIEIDEYTQELVRLLVSGSAIGTKNIHLNFTITAFALSIDCAIPFGLILTELVTNSCKHGFKDKSEGTITLSISRSENGLISLDYHDDGEGLAEGFDIEKSSTLGIKLVNNIITKQMDGSLSLPHGEGFTAHISFRDNLYPPRV